MVVVRRGRQSEGRLSLSHDCLFSGIAPRTKFSRVRQTATLNRKATFAIFETHEVCGKAVEILPSPKYIHTRAAKYACAESTPRGARGCLNVNYYTVMSISQCMLCYAEALVSPWKSALLCCFIDVCYYCVGTGYCIQIEQELDLVFAKSDIKSQFLTRCSMEFVPSIITYGQKSTKKSISSHMENLDDTG